MDSKEMAPGDIERRSFEIITEELGGRTFPPLEEPVVKRVIHTTADFSYADSLVFTHDAAHCALDALTPLEQVILKGCCRSHIDTILYQLLLPLSD